MKATPGRDRGALPPCLNGMEDEMPFCFRDAGAAMSEEAVADAVDTPRYPTNPSAP